MKSRLGNILAVSYGQMTNMKQTQQASAYHTVTTENRNCYTADIQKQPQNKELSYDTSLNKEAPFSIFLKSIPVFYDGMLINIIMLDT